MEVDAVGIYICLCPSGCAVFVLYFCRSSGLTLLPLSGDTYSKNIIKMHTAQPWHTGDVLPLDPLLCDRCFDAVLSRMQSVDTVPFMDENSKVSANDVEDLIQASTLLQKLLCSLVLPEVRHT